MAKTSQFVHFGFNHDTSVFVGASANRASPNVLMLLRVTRRELALCEHKASRPETVTPMFSPDSQRIYFQSDREGKPALYCMHVERLVEPIEAECGSSSKANGGSVPFPLRVGYALVRRYRATISLGVDR